MEAFQSDKLKALRRTEKGRSLLRIAMHPSNLRKGTREYLSDGNCITHLPLSANLLKEALEEGGYNEKRR